MHASTSLSTATNRVERGMEYEAVVKRTQSFAILTCIRTKLNYFFGLCTLTWATAVLLGGFVSILTETEFIGIAILLMAQVVLFGTIAALRGFLPAASLILHRRKSSRWKSILVRSSWVFSQLEFLYSQILLWTWSRNIRPAPTSSTADTLSVLSIKIFLVLTACNSQVSAIGLLFQPLLFPVIGSRCFCLVKYYDMLVWVGLTHGLQGLKQLEVVDALFEMVGQEFRNGPQKPKEVFIAYERMIKYVYGHDKGLEAALTAMQSNDRYVQEAAVHMVGFWAFHYENGDSLKRLRFENALLRSLVGLCTGSAGPIGSRAARSIEMFAKTDPEGLLKAGQQSELVLVQMLVRRVIELVDLSQSHYVLNEHTHDNILHLYESLLFICKALTWLLTCDRDCFCERIGNELQDHLAKRLVGIFQSSHASWKRMQVVVGHTLQLLDSTSLTDAIVAQHLKAETAAPTSYFDLFDEEHEWFMELTRRGESQPMAWDSTAFVKHLSLVTVYDNARNTIVVSKVRMGTVTIQRRSIMFALIFLTIAQWVCVASYTGGWPGKLVMLAPAPIP